jgi:hypothetical protein
MPDIWRPQSPAEGLLRGLNTALDWIQALLEWRGNAAGRMGPFPLPTYIIRELSVHDQTAHRHIQIDGIWPHTQKRQMTKQAAER